MRRQIRITRRASEEIVVLLFLILVAGCVEIAGWADAPIASGLQVVSITSSGDVWDVQVTLDVSYVPINGVTSLVVTAYDSATGTWNCYIDCVSIDDPFQSLTGSIVNDYTVILNIPKTDSGQIIIEARAAHGDECASLSWEGWIPQEASYAFSGGLEFTDDGTAPTVVGELESTQWILSVDACGPMFVTLDTLNCRLLTGPATEVPTWWRVWDSKSDNDGEPDPEELVDTGWIAVADFIAHWNGFEIAIPPGWSGQIRFQATMARSGPADLAGSYSATLTVDVSDET